MDIIPPHPDATEPKLALRISAGAEPTYCICGSLDAFKDLVATLSQRIDEYPTAEDQNILTPETTGRIKIIRVTPGRRYLWGGRVIAADGDPLHRYLSFQVETDLDKYRAASHGFHGWWVNTGKFFAFLILLLFAVIGIVAICQKDASATGVLVEVLGCGLLLGAAIVVLRLYDKIFRRR